MAARLKPLVSENNETWVAMIAVLHHWLIRTECYNRTQ